MPVEIAGLLEAQSRAGLRMGYVGDSPVPGDGIRDEAMQRVVDVLGLLATRLEAQQTAGYAYLKLLVRDGFPDSTISAGGAVATAGGCRHDEDVVGLHLDLLGIGELLV